jgi:hypothetical protein
MSDVLKPVIDGNSIKNGSMVVYQTNTGANSTKKRDPDLNSFIPSGTLFTRLEDRMDEVRYYSGDTAL